jgi:hypothetical protein
MVFKKVERWIDKQEAKVERWVDQKMTEGKRAARRGKSGLQNIADLAVDQGPALTEGQRVQLKAGKRSATGLSHTQQAKHLPNDRLLGKYQKARCQQHHQTAATLGSVSSAVVLSKALHVHMGVDRLVNTGLHGVDAGSKCLKAEVFEREIRSRGISVPDIPQHRKDSEFELGWTNGILSQGKADLNPASVMLNSIQSPAQPSPYAYNLPRESS